VKSVMASQVPAVPGAGGTCQLPLGSESVPAKYWNVSFPAFPVSVSAPPLPVIMSSPLVPLITSFPVVPVILAKGAIAFVTAGNISIESLSSVGS
jgi:hypothetical protein